MSDCSTRAWNVWGKRPTVHSVLDTGCDSGAVDFYVAFG